MKHEKNCKKCNAVVIVTYLVRWSGLCLKCYKKKYRKENSESNSWTKCAKRPRYTGTKGKCRLCGRKFKLEIWQHSTLHWCEKCRNEATYQDFATNETIRERFSRV